MSNVPSDLRYAKSHEWVRIDGQYATIGITDHAQQELTDVVFVELPEEGRSLKSGDPCAVVESVKTASDLYTPLSGVVVEVNGLLADDPAKVNADPFGEGWFFKLKLADASEAEALLDAEGYRALIGDA